MTTDTEEDKAEEVLCHDCGMIASSPTEEARAKGFCHVKVFDPRRRVAVGGDEEDQQEEAAWRLKDDGYYWLCPECFHHMQETLLVVGSGDLSDKFSHRCQHLRKKKREEEK
jgi:hypothetical protein